MGPDEPQPDPQPGSGGAPTTGGETPPPWPTEPSGDGGADGAAPRPNPGPEAPGPPQAPAAPRPVPGPAEPRPVPDGAAPVGPPPHPEILAHNAPLLAGGSQPRQKARFGKPVRALGLTAAAAAAFVLGKFAIGLLTATVVGGALGTVFGGPFARLPGDQQQQLEQRFDAAVGKTLDGLTDAQVSARVEGLVNGGLVRLDDALLTERLRLFVAVLNQTDTATCAALARQTGAGRLEDAVANKAVDTLDTPSLGRWIEINIAAIEAESRGTPAARIADEKRVESIFMQLLPRLSEADTQALIALSAATAVTDESACAAFRSLYTLVGALAEEDLAVMAQYDVAP